MAKRLLLVGSDENLKAVTISALEGVEEWSLELCAVPDQALELIANDPPNAVLYDEALEGYELCEFARQVRHLPGTDGVPIIVAGDSCEESQAGPIGSVWLFTSPIIPEMLLTLLKSAIEAIESRRTFSEEVEGALEGVLATERYRPKEYVQIEGIDVTNLYGEDEDGITLNELTALEEGEDELEFVDIDDSSEFLGVDDEEILEMPDIIDEPKAVENESPEIVETEAETVELLADEELFEVIEEELTDEELETLEVLELEEDDGELEFVEVEAVELADGEEVDEAEVLELDEVEAVEEDEVAELDELDILEVEEFSEGDDEGDEGLEPLDAEEDELALAVDGEADDAESEALELSDIVDEEETAAPEASDEFEMAQEFGLEESAVLESAVLESADEESALEETAVAFEPEPVQLSDTEEELVVQSPAEIAAEFSETPEVESLSLSEVSEEEVMELEEPQDGDLEASFISDDEMVELTDTAMDDLESFPTEEVQADAEPLELSEDDGEEDEFVVQSPAEAAAENAGIPSPFDEPSTEETELEAEGAFEEEAIEEKVREEASEEEHEAPEPLTIGEDSFDFDEKEALELLESTEEDFGGDVSLDEPVEEVEEPGEAEAEEAPAANEVEAAVEAEDDAFSFDELEETVETVPPSAETAEEPDAAGFDFDELEEETPVAAAEPEVEASSDDAFDFDDFESDAGLAAPADDGFDFDELEAEVEPEVAAEAPPAQEDDFSFEEVEAEHLPEATLEVSAPVPLPSAEQGAALAEVGISPEKLEEIIKETVERVVWEVVPPLAEKLISEAIEKLKE